MPVFDSKSCSFLLEDTLFFHSSNWEVSILNVERSSWTGERIPTTFPIHGRVVNPPQKPTCRAPKGKARKSPNHQFFRGEPGSIRSTRAINSPFEMPFFCIKKPTLDMLPPKIKSSCHNNWEPSWIFPSFHLVTSSVETIFQAPRPPWGFWNKTLLKQHLDLFVCLMLGKPLSKTYPPNGGDKWWSTVVEAVKNHQTNTCHSYKNLTRNPETELHSPHPLIFFYQTFTRKIWKAAMNRNMVCLSIQKWIS